MYVGFLLDLLQFSRCKLVQVIELIDTRVFHDSQCNIVVFDCVARDAALCADWDRRCVPPDQFRVGCLQPFDDLRQILFVFSGRDLLFAFVNINELAIVADVFQIVQTKVEMDHVPRFVAQPFV